MGKLSETQFAKQIAELKEHLNQQIELACSPLKRDETSKKQRIHKSKTNLKYFCQTYLPHYFPNNKTSNFQDYVFSKYPKIIAEPDGKLFAVAAPRGESKSTITSVALPLWCCLFSKKRFIILISEAMDQAKFNLAAIQTEFEANPRLKQDFAKYMGIGKVWQAESLITKSNVMIRVAGAKKRIRGWRFGAYRPDLIIPDDLENDVNVRSKSQRDQLESWIDNTLLPMGPPNGSMDCIYVGTVLHHDSVLNRKLKHPAWKSKLFKSILRWPDDMDLWGMWEQLANDDLVKADAFYNKFKLDMNAGAVVSWAVRPLVNLMKLRLGKHQAFNREYQNDPGLDSDAPFKNITIWQQLPNYLVYYGSCDPSMGKYKHQGDFSAILVGAFDRKRQQLFTVVEDIARRPPHQIINKIIAYQKEFNCLVWGIEIVQFQEFFRQQLLASGNAAGVAIPARGLLPKGDKGLRIESLQPYIENGNIQLSNKNSVLYEQLHYYPEADHDDGPDALQMLWMLATSGSGQIPNIKSAKNNNQRHFKTNYLFSYES